MKFAIFGLLALGGCSSQISAQDRLGLECKGQVSLPNVEETTAAEEHYIVDPEKGELILKDVYTGEAITSYELTVEARQYRGERQEDGRTNGGFPIYHYETVHISRETGSITSTSLSTTSLPGGPSTTEMRFEGSCVPEDADKLEELKF